MHEVSQVLLGLTGFDVRAVEVVGAELHVHVETGPERAGCPRCGVLAAHHGRRRVRVRDLPLAGRPVVLVWNKRIWRCREPRCPKVSWSETHPQLRSRRVLTVRAAEEIAATLAGSAVAVTREAVRFGVSWATAWAAFARRAAPAVTAHHRDLAPPKALGVDETSVKRRGPGIRFGDRWCTSIVDVGAGRLLDVRPGRSAAVVTDWVTARGGPDWAAGIEVTVCDPFRPYARGLRQAVPHAALVVDAYHVAKLGLDALDQVRANTLRETLGRRGRKGDDLYDCRRRLLTAPERLSGKSYTALQIRLGRGDRTGHLRHAWRLAHQLRRLGEVSTARAARRRLDAIIDQADASPRPELRRLARTLREWRNPICARYAHGRVTNAAVEGINTQIKKIKRVGHGYRNFTNYRLRLLTYCGKIGLGQPVPTERLRTCQPRVAA